MNAVEQFLKRLGLSGGGKKGAVTRAVPGVAPSPLIMALEPRVVYDASVAAVAAEQHAAPANAGADAHPGSAASNDATVPAAPKPVAEHDVGQGGSRGDGQGSHGKTATGKPGAAAVNDGKVDGSQPAGPGSDQAPSVSSATSGSITTSGDTASADITTSGNTTGGDITSGVITTSGHTNSADTIATGAPASTSKTVATSGAVAGAATLTTGDLAAKSTSAATDAEKTFLVADAVASGAGSRSVVFIDSTVANMQTLIDGLPQGTEYVILKSTSDGFAQMADYLQAHPGADAIHLISHGSDGTVHAGSTTLNASDLLAETSQLARIGAAMNRGGDFLIYGCDVAQSAAGQQLVQEIAALTHLNVAASTDATGAAALGGDWTLEYQSGAVHTAVIESTTAQARYDALLAVTVESYDTAAENNFAAIGSSQFTLDGIVYTFDQAANSFAYNGSNAPQGWSDIIDTATDGVLMLNADGVSAMSNVTISLANGHTFNLTSFDLSSFNGDLYIQAHYANGTSSALIQLATAAVGGYLGNVSSQLGSAFNNIVSFSLIDQNDSGAFEPTLDNLTYQDTGPSVTTSSGSASWSSADNGTGTGGTPVAVDPGLTLSDGGSATAKTATIQINNVRAGDVLGFTAQNGISGTYIGATGTLTLSTGAGTATIAQWQAALESITFYSSLTSPNLNTTTRTISFSFNDGTFTSNIATRTVAVIATDQTPVLTEGGATSTNYLAGTAATAVDANIHVSDADNASLAAATVTIASGYVAGDTLDFNNNNATLYGDIQKSYNPSTHALSLSSGSGTATIAQWQAALDAVTFAASSSTTGGTRDITFTVSDGTKTSVALHHSVIVTAGPAVITDSGSASFVTGDNTVSTPVAVDPGVTISDGNSATLASATVSITGNFQGNHDQLLYTYNPATMGDLSATYNRSTGVLTLTSSSGTASLAQWQAALRSIAFTSDLVVPSNATRTISFQIKDGSLTSPVATRTLTVTATDQTPIIGGGGNTASFVAGDNVYSTPVVINNAVTVADADGGPLRTATITITGNYQVTDALSFTNTSSILYGDIVASYSNNVLVLSSATGTATLAQWQQALRAVTYTSLAITPSNVSRTITSSISDGIKSSTTIASTVTVTDTDQTPLISGSSGSVTLTQGDNTNSTPVVVDSGIVVSDLDNATLTSATISIGNYDGSGDVLLFVGNPSTMGNINGSYSNGVLTLTSAGASATLAQWQAALRSIQFQNFSSAPDITPRVISFSVSDGTKTSSAWNRTVNVDATDQTPNVSTTSSGSVAFVAGDNVASTPVPIDSGIVLSDGDSSTLSSATVQIGAGFHAGEDVLGFTNDGATMGNIFASYDAATGKLTLTSVGATATLAQWQSALRAVTYTDTAVTPGTSTRSISVTVSDGTKTSAAYSRDITVTDTDQTPIIGSYNAGATSFVAGDNTVSTPVVIDNGIVISDLDNVTLASATIQIGAGFHIGEDVLGFVNDGLTMGNIIGTYNAATGKMTLQSAGASATLAQWQAALRSVTYTDTAISPATATRTIAFAVSDGTKTSASLSRDVTVTASNQTPVITSGSTGAASFVAGDNTASTPVTVDNAITLADLDNATLASATVHVGAGFRAGEDVLGFTNDGVTMGNISATYDPATGTLTLTSAGATATLVQWQAALSAVTYTDTAITPDTATRTIEFVVSDGSNSSGVHTRDVTVMDTDQTPVISGSSGAAAFVSGDNTASIPLVIDSGISVADLDNATLASATVKIGSGLHAGEDVLAFVNDGATMGNITASYDTATGTLTLTSAGASATLAQWQAALRSVTYIDTAITPATATRSISFTVSDGSKASAAFTRDVTVTAAVQTPILAAGSGATPTFTASGAGATPVAVDSGISLIDRDAGAQLESAVVTISGNFQADRDVLAFNSSTATGNISASYDARTGVLTLTSAGNTATLAQWQAALAAVTYADTAAESSASTRGIDFQVHVGGKSSASITRTISVAAAPVVTPPVVTPPVVTPPVVTPPAPPPVDEVPPVPPPSQDPVPPALISLLPTPPAMFSSGPGASGGAAAVSRGTAAPDVITFFPLNLTDAISNPLIVADALTDAPAIGAIAGVNTVTFTATEVGEVGDTGGINAFVAASGSQAHGSLSRTTVDTATPIPAPEQHELALSQAGQAVRVIAGPNQVFSISLPLTVGTAGTPAAADAHVSVRMADGRPLPAWVRFDPVRGTLEGRAPANGAGALEIQIVVRDAAGRESRRAMTIQFVDRPGQADAGAGAGHPAAALADAGAMDTVRAEAIFGRSSASTEGAVHADHAGVHELAPAAGPMAQAGQPKDAAPSAKPSLAEQFARAHASLHVAVPAVVASAASVHAPADRPHA